MGNPSFMCRKKARGLKEKCGVKLHKRGARSKRHVSLIRDGLVSAWNTEKHTELTQSQVLSIQFLS